VAVDTGPELLWKCAVRLRNLFFIFACVLLATSPAALADHYGMIVGSEVLDDQIILIDPNDGSWTPIGNDNIGFSGLEFDAVHGRLFATDSNFSNGILYSIDPETGEPTLVGDMDIVNAYGLAYVPSINRLLVCDFPGNLYRVNPGNAQTQLIGEIGDGNFGNVDGLAFDPINEVLYGISDESQAFLMIDPETADAVAMDVDLPNDQWAGLTFDADHGVVYATSVTPSRLYEIDPIAGTTTEVGLLDEASAVHGLAYVPIPQRTVAEIATIDVQIGTLLAGGVEDLTQSDNARVKIKGQFLPNGSPPYQMIVEMTVVTEIPDPVWVDLILESKMSEAGGIAKVYLKDWTTGNFKLIRKVGIGTTDVTIARHELDASRYVKANGTIKVRILHQKTPTNSGSPFRSFVDLLELGVWK
jgi:hypothetical protein